MIDSNVTILRLAAVLMLAGPVACSRSDESTQAGSAEDDPVEAVPSTPMDTEFADALEVDLERMTRLPSGVYYEDLEDGSGLGARDGHVLNVYYTGMLTTGEVFDSNNEGDGYSFQLGRRQVILGWEQGIQGMRIGGKRRLVIPPSLGYGQRGFPPAIPPSATLVFEVELIDIRL